MLQKAALELQDMKKKTSMEVADERTEAKREERKTSSVKHQLIVPGNRFYDAWHFLMFVGISYYILMIPYRAAFISTWNVDNLAVRLYSLGACVSSLNYFVQNVFNASILFFHFSFAVATYPRLAVRYFLHC